jgi:hypothetical protein
MNKTEKYIIGTGLIILAISFFGLLSPYIFPKYFNEENKKS